jgi:hypothetical protein
LNAELDQEEIMQGLPMLGLRVPSALPLTLTLTAGFLAWATAPALAAPVSEEAALVQEELREMGAVFEANPELKTQPGSGWKPYNRLKWFHEQRMTNGELPAPDARWRAWERKRELELERGPATRSVWFSLGPANFGGRMLAIDFDPANSSVVYAGAAGGGVWRSNDGGLTWFPRSDEIPTLAIGGLAVSKVNSSVIVIGTGEGTLNIDRIGGVGILRSTDAGLTWNTTSLSLSANSGHGFHVVEAGPNGTFLAGATDGLWRSSDDGATWTQVRVGGDHYDVKWKPGDPNRCYCVKGDDGAGGNRVRVSTDDGITWTNAGAGQPPSFQIGKSKLAVTAANPSIVYAFFGVFGSGGGITGFYRSTDDGANWTNMNSTGLPDGQSWYNLICAADPDDANRVFVGAVSLARSVNGGASFAAIGGGVHVDYHAIAYQPGNPAALLVGNDGGIWRSTNDGSSWIDGNTNLVSYQFYDICVNNNNSTSYYVMGGTQDNGTDKWSGTTTWANGLGADGMVCNINPQNGTVVYAEIQFGDHRKNTTSGIGAYTPINTGIPGGNAQWVVPVAENPNQGNRLFTNHSNDGIFATANGGTNWVNVAPHNAIWIDISPVNGSIVWTVGAGAPKYSTDDGGTWSDASAFPFLTAGQTKVLAHPTDANAAFVTFSGYDAGFAHIALTTDLGATWADVTGDFLSQPVNAIAVNPSATSQWFIGTDVGVWTSTNGGVNWTPFELGFPNAVVVDLEIQNALQKLVAGTHGRGAWEVDIPAVGTGVEIVDLGEAKNLMLDEPSPNPVTDRTLLRYAAKSEAAVTLRIYDVSGRLVNSLEDFSSGDGIIRTTPWLTDDVPSGVYFAVLQAGEAQKTRKLVVRK